MKKASVVLVGVLMTVMSYQQAWAQKEKYQSIFIYNFSKYVKWPDAQSSGRFVIGVLGNSPIEKELEVMASTKQVNGMPIDIKHYGSPSEIGECHILYICEGESGKIDDISAKVKNKSVLIVTDKPGLAKKGAAINFVEIDGKIKFELNQQNAEDKGLKVSGSLSSLAIVV